MGGIDGRKKAVAITIVLAVLIASIGAYVVYNRFSQSHQVAHPYILLKYTYNDNQTIREVIHIDYKYSIEYFEIERMVASVHTYVSDVDSPNTTGYGDYYHKGPLSDLLNNETSPLTYYDVDNNSILSGGDIFISDLNKITDENVIAIGLSLWIVYDGDEILCFYLSYDLWETLESQR